MISKKHRDYLKRSTFNDNRRYSINEYATLEELRIILDEPDRANATDYIRTQHINKNRLPKF